MNAADENGRELGGDDALAAEYVLGVLPDEERRTVIRRAESDAAFARLIDAWEVRLAPMATAYAAVEPPAAVKAAIDRRLGAVAIERPRPSIWSSLAFWRGLAFASVAALALAVALPALTPPSPTAEASRYVASLAPQQSDVHYFVVYDGRAGDIGLSHVTGERDQGRDFELWVIEGSQQPASLGVIPAGQTVHIPVTEELRRKIAAGATFAISLEPLGGSNTGLPTGPVVAAGDLKSI